MAQQDAYAFRLWSKKLPLALADPFFSMLEREQRKREDKVKELNAPFLPNVGKNRKGENRIKKTTF